MKPSMQLKKVVSLILVFCLGVGMMNLNAFGIEPEPTPLVDGTTETAGSNEDSEDTPICGMEEHTHTAECYAGNAAGNDSYQNGADTEVLGDPICGKQEHTHNENCYKTTSEAVQGFLNAVEEIQAMLNGSGGAASDLAVPEGPSFDGQIDAGTEPDYDEIHSQVEEALALYDALDESERQDEAVIAAHEELMAIAEALPEEDSPAPIGDGVAMIDSTSYETLGEAVAEAEPGATVTLLADVTESITVSKNITIDLGTHTLTGDGGIAINIDNSADVTIQNGTIHGAEGWRAIAATAKTKVVNLTVTDVTMTAGGSLKGEGKQPYGSDFGGACIYINKGTLSVSDCHFSGTAGKYINYYGNDTDACGHHIFIGSPVTTTNISNSTFAGAKDQQYGRGAIYSSGADGRQVTISGCTFSGNTTALILKGKGTVTVSGTTFTENEQVYSTSKTFFTISEFETLLGVSFS